MEFSCQGGSFSWIESGSESSDGSGSTRGTPFSIRKCGTGSLVPKIQTSLPWREWSVPWGSGRVTAHSQGAETGWNRLRSELSISDLALTASRDAAAGLGAAGSAAAGLGAATGAAAPFATAGAGAGWHTAAHGLAAADGHTAAGAAAPTAGAAASGAARAAHGSGGLRVE